MKLNREVFFDHIRNSLFGGKLNSEQVSGTEVLLDEAERLGWADQRHLAYLLATAMWETGRTMQPISEKGGNNYFFRMYDINGDRPRTAQKLGNVDPGDGVKYHGRGYVQITGRANYTDMSKRLNLDLVGNPDLTKNPEVAAVIIFLGMEKGTFTGKKLKDYFNDQLTDPINARRIVNGTDKAQEIAEFYKFFLEAIDNSRIYDTIVVETTTSTLEKRVENLENIILELKRVLERFDNGV